MRNFISILSLILLMQLTNPSLSQTQKFIHPGINQTAADLANMKKIVLNGTPPYKDAFDRLKPQQILPLQ